MRLKSCSVTAALTLALIVTLATKSSAQTLPTSACDLPANENLPFCNPALSIDARVADLLPRIPKDAIPSLLVHNATAVPELGIQAYNWKNPSLHGLSGGAGLFFRPPTPYATLFPQVLGFTSAFNKDLFFRVANATANEARAFYNAGNSGISFYSPAVDIYHDPRWGRGKESPGEDPHLNGQYGVWYTKAFQGDGQFLKTVVGVKHYVAYGVEENRLGLNVDVTPQDLADTYLPPFKDTVIEGKAAGLMCSYNAINGIPGCAHKELLMDVLRGEWGFDGYVVTDNSAGIHIWRDHGYAKNETEVVKYMLEAGVDNELHENPGWAQFYPKFIEQAKEEGLITQAQVETALARLLRVQFRLGIFEKSSARPYRDITHELYVDTEANQALALEAAQKSIVLLKNEANALPLNEATYTATRKLVLIGPHFNASKDLQSAPEGRPSFVHTPYESILKNYVGATALDFAEGCDVVSLEGGDLDSAVTLAGQASTEQIVLFVGLNLLVEWEPGDRYNLTWPGQQAELIQRVLAAAANPVIIVLITGGPVDIADLKANPKVGAILYAGYGGQAGGLAIADVLFGKVNPAGRLTHTFYTDDFVRLTNITDMGLRPNSTTGNPGRGYRFYTGEPVYEFGYGLSYTSFNYAWSDSGKAKGPITVQVGPKRKATDPKLADCALALNVTVGNNGEGGRTADHSVLFYVSPPGAGQNGRPLKYLIQFDYLDGLQPAESRQVEVCLNRPQFELANEQGDFELITGTWRLTVGPLEQLLSVNLP